MPNGRIQPEFVTRLKEIGRRTGGAASVGRDDPHRPACTCTSSRHGVVVKLPSDAIDPADTVIALDLDR